MSNDIEQTKIYTKRENARRAGFATGALAELVEITVHKSADGVRFGWKALDDLWDIQRGTYFGKGIQHASPRCRRWLPWLRSNTTAYAD